MAPDPEHQLPASLRVNWAVVLTNAVGVVVGISLTACVTGIVYLVWTVPNRQEQILQNQVQFKELTERLERSDRAQDTRITVLETKSRH